MADLHYRFPLSTLKRAELGCITSWQDEQGSIVTLHEVGSARKVIKALAAKLPGFRLVSWSTPDTILRDLRGRDMEPRGVRKRSGRLQRAQSVERRVLSNLHRLDLLHPSLGGPRWR